jgi:hypothetical protein
MSVREKSVLSSLPLSLEICDHPFMEREIRIADVS